MEGTEDKKEVISSPGSPKEEEGRREKFQSERDLNTEKSRSRSRSNDPARPRRGVHYAPRGRGDRRRDRPFIKRPDLSGGLLTYKQFMELQGDPIDPFEAQKFYEDYKKDYEKKQLEIFFVKHKEEHWFIEKYDPQVSQRWQEERYLNAKVLHKFFLEGVRTGKFQGLHLRDSSPNISGPPYYGFDPNSMTLFLKTIPVNISRWDLLNVVKTSPGFVSLSMSEPLKSQGYCRFAWVLYDSEEHCNESLTLLANKTVTADFKLSPVRSQSSSRKDIKVQPPQSWEAFAMDWVNTARLISHLDREKGMNENPLLISEEKFRAFGEDDKEVQIDLQLLYLRKVHAFCYFCMEEYEDERMLAAKCGPAHIRSKPDDTLTGHDPRLDTVVDERLQKPRVMQTYDQEVLATQKDMELKRLIQDFETKEIGQEENKNMRCNICKKLFVGVEFIRKHLHNKHQDQIGDIIRKVLFT